VYLSCIIFKDLPPADAIALSIKFTRLTNMFNITDPKPLIADSIEGIIVSIAPLYIRIVIG
jgi:hypothetical protein